YLDSFLPENGKCLADYLPAPHPIVDGRIEPLDFRSVFGITNEQDLAWITPRLRNLPEKCETQPADLPAAVAVRQTYILCSTKLPFFEEAAGRARRRGFRVLDLTSADHCPMVTQPDELAKLLLSLV